MRKVALVFLAAVIAGAVTFVSARGSFNEFVESISLWTGTGFGRQVVTAAIAIVGITGWIWGFRHWRHGRDSAQQIQVLQEKLVTLQQRHVTLRQKLDELPVMMTRVFVPCFNFLMHSLISKLPPRERQDVVATLQSGMESNGEQTLVQSPYAPPMRFKDGRLVPKRSPSFNEAFHDALPADLPQEVAGAVKLAPEEESLFEDRIEQIVRQGIDKSLRGVGIRSREVEYH
jgi:hypothetical protein